MESIDVGHENDGDAGRADGRVSLHEFQDAVNLWVKAGQSSDRLAEHQRQASFRATPRSTPRRSPRPGGDGGSASSSLKLKKDDIKSVSAKAGDMLMRSDAGVRCLSSFLTLL